MNQPSSTGTVAISVVALIVLSTIPFNSQAGGLSFRLSFEDLPGVDAVESGDIAAGVAALEAQVADREAPTYGYALATLCGVYVMAKAFGKAVDTCDEAVANGPADTAYNNRGVMRVHLGDLAGARADFNRARPENMDEYLERIRISDPRLIAESNYDTLDVLKSRKLAAAKAGGSRPVGPAIVEDILK